MQKSKTFSLAALFLGMIFILSPLYSFARDHYEKEDDEYEYKQTYAPVAQPTPTQLPTPQQTMPDTSVLDAAQQQLNAQNAALEARRAQLEQQSTQQQQLAEQLSSIEKQLNDQRAALEAKGKELAQQKTEQDAVEQQLNDLTQQLSSGTQAFNVIYPKNDNGEYTVKDDNYNGISDILEGFSKVALR